MLSYLIFALTIGGIYALLALSLNLVWGSAGMVNLGLAGFFGVGAYASAIATGAGAPVVFGWGIAALAGVAVGLIVTFATLRLRDDYLAIVTLGFAEMVRLVALNERWLTKGADGISGIAAPMKAELGTGGFNLFYLAVVSLLVIAVWWILARLDASPYGRTLKAIREDQELARFAGKPVLRFKYEAFAVSAAIAALAGALYAHFQSYFSPDHVQPLITIYIFLGLTAGGVGRPTGAVAGGYAVLLFIEATRFAADVVPGLEAVQVAAFREILIGAALLIVLHLKPQGFLPETMQKAPKKLMSPDLANLLAAPGQPETLYRALDATTKSRVGHKLFTLLYVDGSEVARVYSNQPEAYPVFGRKPMGPTPWGAHVMEGRKPFLGRDMEAIRWAFFDHALIASLGCGSVINIPIVYDGETIGTMNLLDAEHHYTEADVPKVAELAPLLIPAFLIARNQA